MQLFDVHCHLQEELVVHRIGEIISRAEGAGVRGMMCCGIHEGDWALVEALCGRYEALFPSFGLHPWFIGERSDGWLDKLEGMIKDSTAAVGEIGLDHQVEGLDRKVQADVFVAQLRLAAAYRRPVSIHCRKAWGTLLEILRGEGGLPHGGVIHSFSGSGEMVRELEKLGAFISFSGSVTRQANKKVAVAVKAVSRERLLLETDSPYILPDGVGASFNEPAHIRQVLARVAGIRGESEEEVAVATYENARRVFSLL